MGVKEIRGVVVNEAISLGGGEIKIVVCRSSKSARFGVLWCAGSVDTGEPDGGNKSENRSSLLFDLLVVHIKGAHQSANEKGKKKTISWQLFPLVQRQAFNRLPVERGMANVVCDRREHTYRY